jgi:NAD(P)-dependent dehydrogenase (short-subunit alcohol dehydrogenase family)
MRRSQAERDHAAYNAAKGGVHGLTTGMAREFAKDGITVNTVAPCAVNTPHMVAITKSNPALAAKFVSAPYIRGARPLPASASIRSTWRRSLTARNLCRIPPSGQGHFIFVPEMIVP